MVKKWKYGMMVVPYAHLGIYGVKEKPGQIAKQRCDYGKFSTLTGTATEPCHSDVTSLGLQPWWGKMALIV